MRIKDFRTHVVDVFRTNLVFLELEADDGTTGVGEATLEYREHAVVGALKDIEEDVLGQDATRLNKIVTTIHRDSYWRRGPVLRSALSAVEMALIDLNARSLNVPVHRLLGGKVRETVPAYANGWFAGARTPEEFATAAASATNRGFTGLKFDPFGSAHLTIDSHGLDQALTTVGAVRDAIGPSADLMIEGHGRFTQTTAIRVARELAQFDILWFEEPCPPESLEALAQVRARAAVPIAAGERLCDRHSFAELLRKGAVDFIQPDVSHVGGITELIKIADLAATHDIEVAPHNPSGPVATAATLHLAAVLPAFRYLEIMATDVPWRQTLSTEKLQFSGGRMHIPDSIGLGLTLNRDSFQEHPYQRRTLRHYTGRLTDIRPPDAVTYF